MSRRMNKMGKASFIKSGIKSVILSILLPFLFLAPSSDAKAATSEDAAHGEPAVHGESVVSTEATEEAKKKAEEARLAKLESEEEVRLSRLNQTQIHETDRRKSDRLEDAKLGVRLGSPVVEVKGDSKDTEGARDGVQGICGTLLDYMGKVEILDSTRSHILESKPNIVFPCGSWISVKVGWAQIKFMDGQKVRLGHDTLVQVHADKDQLILFRGATYVESDAGNGEFRLATSIGRARVKGGKVAFLYSPDNDTTQLITLENSATLENRFEGERRVVVQTGESSELNFKQLRVIPLLPSSVASASLKKILDQLGVPELEKAQAVRLAAARQEKKFAILRKKEFLEKIEDSSSEESSGGGRGLASISVKKQKALEKLAKTNQPYLRHATDPHYPKLQEQMISRITGGSSFGSKLVNPKIRGQQDRRIASEGSEAVQEATSQSLLPAEESAKRKLIHDLSKIKIE